MDVIYLDYNASFPLRAELLNEFRALAERAHGNPSSPHGLGRQSRKLVNDAAETLGQALNCPPESIHWTSGASEANAWVYRSFALATGSRRPKALVSVLEHDSTLLAARDADVEFLRSLPTGQIDLAQLAQALKGGNLDLVSIGHANNETGVLQPLAEIAALCAAAGVPLHLDCAQSLGKLDLDLASLPASVYATFSAHKIGGPKGVGALVTSSPLRPLIHGRQQKGLRGGTENVLGVALFARAAELARRPGSEAFPAALGALRDRFESELRAAVPGTLVHGAKAPRLANTSFVGFEAASGDGILVNLDLAGICASSGSACSSGAASASHVLVAMGCEEGVARGSVRLSSGMSTEWRDYERVLEILPAAVERARAGKRRVS